MKYLLSIVFAFAAVNWQSYAATENHQEVYVYICTGPTASRYHRSQYCSGLNNCSGSIVQVTLAKAKAMHRTPCKKCY